MKKNRIRELEEIIISLDTAFEKGEDCVNQSTGEIVSDNDYDSLKRELYSLCPGSKIFDTITSSKIEVAGKNKVVHDPPMNSINKCNAGTEEEKFEILNKWFEDCRKVDKDIEFSMSYKIDGLACSLVYKKGNLISAGLRSKSGMDGISIIQKTQHIKNIPQKLEIPVSCVVRGEIEISKSEFAKQCEILGENSKKNCRAHCAGSMNQKIAEKMKDRGLHFTSYNVLNLRNAPYRTEIELAKWAEETLKLKFVETIPFNIEKLKEMEEEHRKKDTLIDGIVISVNNLELQERLGRTGGKPTGNPKGKLAFKFRDEIKLTTVIDIEWNTGRTGNICPVLIVKKIELEGTTISRCTAHNLGIIKDNKIGVGTKIEIIKSGKIIPKIKKVVESKGDSLIPEFCPSCNSKLIEIEGNNNSLSLNCNNKENCPAQNIKTLDHYLNILGIKGISEKTIEKIIETGLLKKRSDFYKLDFEKLIGAGFPRRSSILIDARIQQIENPETIKNNDKLIEMVLKKHKELKNIPIEKFIASLGIEESGKENGRLLKQSYNSFEEIRNLTIEEMEKIEGIGPITSRNIYNFFKENKDEINELLKFIR